MQNDDRVRHWKFMFWLFDPLGSGDEDSVSSHLNLGSSVQVSFPDFVRIWCWNVDISRCDVLWEAENVSIRARCHRNVIISFAGCSISLHPFCTSFIKFCLEVGSTRLRFWSFRSCGSRKVPPCAWNKSMEAWWTMKKCCIWKIVPVSSEFISYAVTAAST